MDIEASSDAGPGGEALAGRRRLRPVREQRHLHGHRRPRCSRSATTTSSTSSTRRPPEELRPKIEEAVAPLPEAGHHHRRGLSPSAHRCDRIVVVGASLAGPPGGGDAAPGGLRRHAHRRRRRAARALRPAAAVQAGAGRRLGGRPTPACRCDDDDLDVDWRARGQRATGLDLGTGAVALADGATCAFDGLVIATGAAPGTLPGAGATWPASTCCARSTTAWPSGPTSTPRPAGWSWSAPASSAPRWRPPAASAGLEVTVVEALPVPLERVLGDDMGARVRRPPPRPRRRPAPRRRRRGSRGRRPGRAGAPGRRLGDRRRRRRRRHRRHARPPAGWRARA